MPHQWTQLEPKQWSTSSPCLGTRGATVYSRPGTLHLPWNTFTSLRPPTRQERYVQLTHRSTITMPSKTPSSGLGNCNTVPQRCAPIWTRSNWALASTHHGQHRSNQPPTHRAASWTPCIAVFGTWAYCWTDSACRKFWSPWLCPTTYTS